MTRPSFMTESAAATAIHECSCRPRNDSPNLDAGHIASPRHPPLRITHSNMHRHYCIVRPLAIHISSPAALSSRFIDHHRSTPLFAIASSSATAAFKQNKVVISPLFFLQNFMKLDVRFNS
nr:uncharacterized protein LOC114925195 [Arachis hypogaea]